MSASAVSLRAAIHDALRNDGPLAAMLGGAKIYDEPPREAALPAPPAFGPPEAIAFDLPQLRDETDPPLQYLAVHASPWPGAMAVWRSAGGESYERIALGNIPSIVGELLDALPAGPVARWDRANRFAVKLASGTLASQSDLRVLGGANVAAIRNGDGGWEVIQFANAELVAENTYALSRLLRGQQGSEWAMPSLHEPGSKFVLLDPSLIVSARGVDLLGRNFRYRVGASTHDVGSPFMTAFEKMAGAVALRPRSPAHLAARRTGAGIAITWIRRTRTGGDSWDALEVPLGEERERYRIEILDGENVVRAIETDEPSAIYAAADELTDFGSAQSALSLSVMQLSAVAGAGFAQNATLTI